MNPSSFEQVRALGVVIVALAVVGATALLVYLLHTVLKPRPRRRY